MILFWKSYKKPFEKKSNGFQFFLLHLGLGFVDKSNLLGGHSLGDELLADVLIDGAWSESP